MNNDDMSNLFNQFSKAVNEGNIPDEMKNIISSLNSNNANSNNEGKPNISSDTIDMETLMKMKSVMEKMNSTDNPSANLLKSLKPYLKDSRKDKVDEYIKLLGMGKAMEVFKDLSNNKG